MSLTLGRLRANFGSNGALTPLSAKTDKNLWKIVMFSDKAPTSRCYHFQ